MRVGLIARADDRGLGVQTWEWYRHMKPSATLVVELADLAAPFIEHRDRYTDATWARWDGSQFLDPALVLDWLEDVDVLYTAETIYDERLAGWCTDKGVRVFVHANPELWKWGRHLAAPAVHPWVPTSWRINHLPDDTVVVPVPVPMDRWPTPAPHRTNDETVFVHIAGKRAMADRNGTTVLMEAIQRIEVPMRLRVITQDARLPIPRLNPHVELERITGGVEDYWRLYDDADVLVMPRRYGGLCLPVNEAAGAGLGIVMTDVAPNRRWPIQPVAWDSAVQITTQGGVLEAYRTNPGALVETLTMLATDTARRHQLQDDARAWAQSQSWDELAPTIREALGC